MRDEISPNEITSEERFNEIASLLAASFIRLKTFNKPLSFPAWEQDAVDLRELPSIHADNKKMLENADEY